MANVVSLEKARKCRENAFLTNIRYMQEKVAALKAADDKEAAKANSPVNQDNGKAERN